jgi:hypothetical protein
MDPYLETPGIWPGFHNRFAVGISDELDRVLPAPYYADIEERAEMGIIEESDEQQRIVLDIVVVRHPHSLPRDEGGGVAVATRTRRQVSPNVELEVLNEPIRHLLVEIRDPTRGHKLVTLIEIVSPSNNRPGQDREAYARKQREVLESDASLVELDLLRGGRRIVTDVGLAERIERLKPKPAYVVLVNRVWKRGGGLITCQVFPFGLRDLLPCIAVPLKEGEPEVLLDLQDIFNRAYDTGPYRRGAVDYAGPVPAPALDPDDAAWAAELTRPWRPAKSDAPGG